MTVEGRLAGMKRRLCSSHLFLFLRQAYGNQGYEVLELQDVASPMTLRIIGNAELQESPLFSTMNLPTYPDTKIAT